MHLLAEIERILVVDDEEPIRKLLARLLGAQGYECVTAESAAQARRQLSHQGVRARSSATSTCPASRASTSRTRCTSTTRTPPSSSSPASTTIASPRPRSPGRLRLRAEALQGQRAADQRRQRPAPPCARAREPSPPRPARAGRARAHRDAARHDRPARGVGGRGATATRGDDPPALVGGRVPQPRDGPAHRPHEPLLRLARAARRLRRRPGGADPDREPDARRGQDRHPGPDPAQAGRAHGGGARR